VKPIVRLHDNAGGSKHRRLLATAAPVALVLALGCAHGAVALAQGAAPHWSILSQSQPAHFQAGGADAYVLTVRNDGGAPTAPGSVVTVTDTLPSGVTDLSVKAEGEAANGDGLPRYTMACPPEAESGIVACSYQEGLTQGPILPGATITITIVVSIPALTELEANSATVAGGGAPSATISESTPLDGEPTPFGLSLFVEEAVDEDGQDDTQAGSHPFELTTSLAFDVAARETPGQLNDESESPLADAAPKDVEISFPPGLVGDPTAVPRCSQQAFLEKEGLNCPLDTQVGTVKPLFYGRFHSAVYPVFDVVPVPGSPAELGFSIAGVGHVPIFFQLRSGESHPPGDEPYGLTAQLRNIAETGPLQGVILTLWGVPAAPSHNSEREGTLGEGAQGSEVCKPSARKSGGVEEAKTCPSDAVPKPFLTLPTGCQTSPLKASVYADSWEQPAPPPLRSASMPAEIAGAIGGCEALSFDPSLSLAPETLRAGAPSGYTLDVHMRQSDDPNSLATPEARKLVVSLPVGTTISASVANGLETCSPAQFEPPPSEPGSSAPGVCPRRSRIGAATIDTPLMASPLEGQVFLGEPQCSPCSPADAQEGKLIKLLVQAQGAGMTVKLEGSASIDQATGQLTITFDETPQLPFEDVKITLDGGANAPLANASTCGVPLAASSQLTSYSSETPAEPSSEPFELTGCATPQFRPSFVAGTTVNEAAGFSPLTLTLSRGAEEQALASLGVKLPPGVLALISKVYPCPRAQAEANTCPTGSEIGTATVGAGPGADPLFLEGSVYLTGPYEGAPFGLSIVVAAKMGPLDLGTLRVGARIEVDPQTAALSVISDPLPQSLDGIPLQLRTLELNVDREAFVFNPSSCEAQAVEGTLAGAAGTSATVSSRFQAVNCAALAFKPKLTALTRARASKADGVHLHLRVLSGAGPGSANLAKLQVELPKRMTPRLSTWQRACMAVSFEADPASCPAASVVGSATVLTPVLRAPLSGPVYVVSRGHAASPELAIVLQSEGVALDVVGQTSIKGGVDSLAFRALPDAPISELDVLLEAGPHSLLAANLPASAHENMCGLRLSMPVQLTGQNGAFVKQAVPVSVSGCEHPKPKPGSRRAPRRGGRALPTSRR
jgi:uncharacterized repeat protein (TIGR01451 family)